MSKFDVFTESIIERVTRFRLGRTGKSYQYNSHYYSDMPCIIDTVEKHVAMVGRNYDVYLVKMLIDEANMNGRWPEYYVHRPHNDYTLEESNEM